MIEMTEKTKELLLACKKAGYEAVTVLVRDKKVPRSKTIKAGPWFGDEPRPNDLPNSPIKVVCGHPERLGKCSGLPGTNWPKMWDIVKKCGLARGTKGGNGMGDCHDIHPASIPDLTPGCYELSEAV